MGTPYDVASLSSNGQLYAVGGWAEIDAIYVYEDMAPAPAVTAVSESSGSTIGGISITITGTGFAAGATVSIGGSPCSDVVVVSSTEMTCTTPANSSGARDVSVTNPDAQVGTLSNGYTYVTPPAPTASKVSPSSGNVKGGTEITITGTNFDSEATVTVGGMPCK